MAWSAGTQLGLRSGLDPDVGTSQGPEKVTVLYLRHSQVLVSLFMQGKPQWPSAAGWTVPCLPASGVGSAGLIPPFTSGMENHSFSV